MPQLQTFIGGKIITWTPLPGLDPTLGDKALQVGAMVYGTAIHQGKPEEVAQQEAEKAMYQMVYGIRY